MSAVGDKQFRVNVATALLGLGALSGSVCGYTAELSDFGQNALQTSSGGAVHDACRGMIPISDTLTGDTQQLFFRCGELVNTGNDLAGDAAGTGNTLGISADELALALQDVAPEETEVMGAGVTDTSHDNLATLRDRLEYLRTGTSTLGITSLNWSGGETIGGAAGEGMSRFGAFFTGIYGTGDKDETNPANGVENGFDFDAYGLTAGLDYRFTEAFIAGISLAYMESETEFELDRGENETEGYSAALYGTWYRERFFLEGAVIYGDYTYDAQRNIRYANNNPNNPSAGRDIERTVRSSTDGENWSWSIGGGYSFNNDNQEYVLGAKLTGLDAEIDAYSETGAELAMALDKQDIESIQSILSAQATVAMSQDWGVFIPFATIAWHHEFEDDSRDINARYVFDPNGNVMRFTTDPGDENYYRLSLGSNFVLQNGSQIFLNYDTLLGLSDVSSHVLTLGLRIEF
jgi:outer membrane autotransporter protein